jgi:hypothetical protein
MNNKFLQMDFKQLISNEELLALSGGGMPGFGYDGNMLP